MPVVARAAAAAVAAERVMVSAFTAEEIVIPVQRGRFYLRGIAGRDRFGRPVAPCAIVAPHLFRAGERPACHACAAARCGVFVSVSVLRRGFDIAPGVARRLLR